MHPTIGAIRTMLRVEAPADATLVARAQDGDLDAFAELVRRHESRVRGVLVRLLDDDRDVEEAVQDTFVQAWRHLDRFRGEAQLFTWLYRIATNEAFMRRRRKRPQTTELDEGTAQSDAAGPEAAAEAGDVRDFLLACIRELPFEYRAPLVLRDVEGLSNQEVADVLDISLAAAKSRIHRARMQIRAALDEREKS
jgi:RNA polymerase sigma-70 factor (ECF subfamily)